MRIRASLGPEGRRRVPRPGESIRSHGGRGARRAAGAVPAELQELTAIQSRLRGVAARTRFKRLPGRASRLRHQDVERRAGRNAAGADDAFGAAWAQIDPRAQVPGYRSARTCCASRRTRLSSRSFYYLRLPRPERRAQWWSHKNSEDRYNYLYSAEAEALRRGGGRSVASGQEGLRPALNKATSRRSRWQAPPSRPQAATSVSRCPALRIPRRSSSGAIRICRGVSREGVAGPCSFRTEAFARTSASWIFVATTSMPFDDPAEDGVLASQLGTPASRSVGALAVRQSFASVPVMRQHRDGAARRCRRWRFVISAAPIRLAAAVAIVPTHRALEGHVAASAGSPIWTRSVGSARWKRAGRCRSSASRVTRRSHGRRSSGRLSESRSRSRSSPLAVSRTIDRARRLVTFAQRASSAREWRRRLPAGSTINIARFISPSFRSYRIA